MIKKYREVCEMGLFGEEGDLAHLMLTLISGCPARFSVALNIFLREKLTMYL